MKYDIKMGSVAMIHIPSFIKIDSNIQKLTEGDTQTHREDGDRITPHLFFQYKESRLKRESRIFGLWIQIQKLSNANSNATKLGYFSIFCLDGLRSLVSYHSELILKFLIL
jgi:hypothetical protein